MQAVTAEQRNPNAEAEGLRLEDVLQVLLRRKKFILLVSLAAAVGTLIVVLFLADQYSAIAIASPPSLPASSTNPLLGQAGSGFAAAALGIKNQGDQMVSILRTQAVEDVVVERFGLIQRYHVKKPSQARKKLESHSGEIGRASCRERV